jgi:peptide/nickel transport system ATP-binding protein
MDSPVLEVEGLGVTYGERRRLFGKSQAFEAARDVTFTIAPGEAFAIVGESGAGKSTVARCVAGLLRPTTGSILFRGKPLDLRRRGGDRRAVQMVFQDPYSSLNPRMTVGTMLTELLRVNKLAASSAAATARAGELMEMVGMPASALEKRPGAFSGGQRQRIGIARALAVEPTLLLADEPVSALDVSIQAAILLLLKRLQRELGLTMLFISHDLAVVHQLCDRVAVMCDGEVVEQGRVDSVFSNPQRDFTKLLLAAATELPPLDPRLEISGAAEQRPQR